MKNFKLYVLAIATALTFSSCNNDNDDPIPVNEEELITTVTAVFTPEGGGTAVTLQYKDLDGEGANAPVVTVSSAFAKNKTYNGTVTFKNDLANPAEDITSEILEEGEEHQIFYQKTGTLNALTYGTSSSNFDKNGKPIGLQSVFTTTEAASGTLTITLRHEPNKSATNVASGDITNAGGSTDAEVTFSISVL
ncbi:type 1 periplasmic binding fold superfamily protein [Flavobacterium sp. A45]|nr:type 1 periplasmic binding fold superfamily protein [Flavobacterium sp. A45]